VGSDLPLTLAWSRIHGPLRAKPRSRLRARRLGSSQSAWEVVPKNDDLATQRCPPPKGGTVPRERPLRAGEDCTLEATPTALSSSVSTTRILAVIEALCQPSERLLGMYIYASGRPRTVAVACSWGQGSDCYPSSAPTHPREEGRAGAQQGTEAF